MNVATSSSRSATETSGDSVHSWGATHTGPVRHVNQDRFLAREDLGLWLVADGAGGHERGDDASQAIVDAFAKLPAELADDALANASARSLEDTHHLLRRLAHAPTMLLSTAVVLILRREKLTCLWAGDSRAYRFRDGRLSLLTRDHSLVQELVDAGRITAGEARRHPHRNVITRAVGADCEMLAVETVTADVQTGDLYLLCSDGLSNTLSESEIAAAFARPRAEIAAALVESALVQHAADNVTALVVAVPPRLS